MAVVESAVEVLNYSQSMDFLCAGTKKSGGCREVAVSGGSTAGKNRGIKVSSGRGKRRPSFAHFPVPVFLRLLLAIFSPLPIPPNGTPVHRIAFHLSELAQ